MRCFCVDALPAAYGPVIATKAWRRRVTEAGICISMEPSSSVRRCPTFVNRKTQARTGIGWWMDFYDRRRSCRTCGRKASRRDVDAVTNTGRQSGAAGLRVAARSDRQDLARTVGQSFAIPPAEATLVN